MEQIIFIRSLFFPTAQPSCISIVSYFIEEICFKGNFS